MDTKEILSHVDHTLLSQTSTWEEIKTIIDDGIHYKTASICIPPSYVSQAYDYVQSLSSDLKICTVIGFPNGYSTTETKIFESIDAVQNGASEIDMVVNIGWVKDKRFADISKEISLIKEAIKDRILKVIIETCFLSEEEIIELCKIVSESDAEYIKTSTGFGGGGATFSDVELMVKTCKELSDRNEDDVCLVKASGGISSLEDAKHFLDIGADRLGTSKVVKIVKELSNV